MLRTGKWQILYRVYDVRSLLNKAWNTEKSNCSLYIGLVIVQNRIEIRLLELRFI